MSSSEHINKRVDGGHRVKAGSEMRCAGASAHTRVRAWHRDVHGLAPCHSARGSTLSHLLNPQDSPVGWHRRHAHCMGEVKGDSGVRAPAVWF